jgi:uncharacterized NAD(P)/FAD-binding protein YdhS
MNSLDSNPRFKLAFIGAGISSAYTMLNYISVLGKEKPGEPVKIAIIEKTGEFWTGVPYGKKTGANPLLITSLKEFIAQEEERRHFAQWLSENKDWVFSSEIPIEGKMMKKWWADHQTEIQSGDWDDIFIPRRAFGLYLQHEVHSAMKNAEAIGLIQPTYYTAQVNSVSNVNGNYEIKIEEIGKAESVIQAEKAILAVGSPPNVGFWKDQEILENSGITYIQNVYEPSMDETLRKLKSAVAPSKSSGGRGVLIIGSNASTLDTLFTFCNEETTENRVDHFYIISPNASFPHRISRKHNPIAYSPKFLLNLAREKEFFASDILKAVQNEVKEALEKGFNISDIFPEISKGMINCLDLLSVEEQKRFVAKESIEIGKMQRRAGYEYLEVVEMLKSQGRITMLKGRFSRFCGFESENALFEYFSGREGHPEILKAPVQVVINCAGFQDLGTPPKGLIQNLIDEGICEANESKRGFVINENFESNPNFFVMGPLVAGNVNNRLRVWHAESCTRIITLSKQLAEVLVA